MNNDKIKLYGKFAIVAIAGAVLLSRCESSEDKQRKPLLIDQVVTNS